MPEMTGTTPEIDGPGANFRLPRQVDVKVTFVDALRARVGLGKRHSRATVCDAADIEENTLAAYLSEKSCANLHIWLKLAAILGPDFVNEHLALIGLGGCRPLFPTSATPFLVNAYLADAVAMFARHLADGRLDHRELAEQEPVLRQLHHELSGYLDGLSQARDGAA